MKQIYTPTKESVVTCKRCNTDFLTRYGQKKFCTDTCQIKNQYKYIAPRRLCRICSKEAGRGNKYCEEHRIYHKNKPLKEKTCIGCSLDLTGTSLHKYCKKCSIKTLKVKSFHYRKFANTLKNEWRKQGKTCVWCGSLEITVDHIISYKKGGSLMGLNNLQPMCHLCNISKGNKLPSEYGACERHFIYVLKRNSQ